MHQRPTKKTGRKGKQKQKQKGSGACASPQVLFVRAQEAIGRDDFEAALSLLERAVEMDPSDCEINDAYGCLLAEHGQAEKAAEVLRRSVTISPGVGHEKYLYLGQLLEGEGAIASVAKGVEILERELTRLVGCCALVASVWPSIIPVESGSGQGSNPHPLLLPRVEWDCL